MMMIDSIQAQYIAFIGHDLIASGAASTVAARVKEVIDAAPAGAILIFNSVTSEQVEWDLRGSGEDVLSRLTRDTSVASEVPGGSLDSGGDDADDGSASAGARKGPGRRKLGVVSREVTLLPRHWEWLSKQSGGASVTLRKLVEAARAAGGDEELRRLSRESTYRFMSAMGGNFPGYEEAIRALFAGNQQRFFSETSNWPEHVRVHATVLASGSFPNNSDSARMQN